MNKFFSMLSVVMFAFFAMSCNKADAGKAGSSAKTDKDAETEIGFFKDLGIDTREIPLGETLKMEGDYAHITLSTAQQKALLTGAGYQTDEEYVPRVELLGVKPLSDGKVLAAYFEEGGDGSVVFFVSYDKGGKVLDMLNTMRWKITIDDYAYMESGDRYLTADVEESYLTVKNEQMTLHRSIARRDLKTKKDAWSQQRDYCVSIGEDGTFVIDEVKKVDTKVNCPADEADEIDALYDMSDFFYYSMNSKRVFSDFEAYLTSGKVNTTTKRESMLNTLSSLFYQHTDKLFSYMCEHKRSRIWECLETCVSEGALQKSELYDAIQKLPEGAEKNYLNETTGQWGLAGAMG